MTRERLPSLRRLNAGNEEPARAPVSVSSQSPACPCTPCLALGHVNRQTASATVFGETLPRRPDRGLPLAADSPTPLHRAARPGHARLPRPRHWTIDSLGEFPLAMAAAMDHDYYDGFRTFSWLADLVGLPIDQVRPGRGRDGVPRGRGGGRVGAGRRSLRRCHCPPGGFLGGNREISIAGRIALRRRSFIRHANSRNPLVLHDYGLRDATLLPGIVLACGPRRRN